MPTDLMQKAFRLNHTINCYLYPYPIYWDDNSKKWKLEKNHRKLIPHYILNYGLVDCITISTIVFIFATAIIAPNAIPFQNLVVISPLLLAYPLSLMIDYVIHKYSSELASVVNWLQMETDELYRHSSSLYRNSKRSWAFLRVIATNVTILGYRLGNVSITFIGGVASLLAMNAAVSVFLIGCSFNNLSTKILQAWRAKIVFIQGTAHGKALRRAIQSVRKITLESGGIDNPVKVPNQVAKQCYSINSQKKVKIVKIPVRLCYPVYNIDGQE
ncbi:unnamed protein product [Orchesella dallaii]|uniref:ABC transmembrane type-1 domain-containing protein n=1 Tax=Orchesella dallaii TaxID=48710 RepID=A0ABP1QVA3_9HEXA